MRKLFCCLLVIILPGCKTLNFSIFNPIKNSNIELQLCALDNINLNKYKQASPLAIKIFILEDDSYFLAADYSRLRINALEELQSNFIDEYDFLLAPNSYKKIDNFPIAKNARYLAVAAFTKRPEVMNWRSIVKLSPDKKNILVVISNQNVTIHQGK